MWNVNTRAGLTPRTYCFIFFIQAIQCLNVFLLIYVTTNATLGEI